MGLARHLLDTRHSLLSPLFHPSGGLVYHWRAWRWGHTLWAPFHEQVRRWLTDWRPLADCLVLVGPSAGYALSRPFLERFAHISVLEPDPLARRILQHRFPGLTFHVDHHEGLAHAGGLRALAPTYPGAAFLFCNLLGQVPVGASPAFDKQAWLAELESGLASRAWASWHDLASTRRPPDAWGVHGSEWAESLETTLARYWQGGELEVHDHECAGLCPALPRQYALWQLAPGQHHVIEWLARTR